MTEPSDMERLLTASVEIARRDTVIRVQKRLIAAQRKDISLLSARLDLLENKLLKVAEDSGQFETQSKLGVFKRTPA